MKNVKVKKNKKNINKTKDDNKKSKILSYGVLILLILLLVLNINNIKKSGLLTLKSKAIDYYENIDVPYEKDTVVKRYKNEILVINQNKVYTVNKSGKITWKKELNNIDKPLISIENNYIIIADRGGKNFYVFKNKNQILDNEVKGEIKQIDINSKGKIAIIYSGEGYKSILNIYNKNSTLELKMPLDTDIANNVILSNDGKFVYFSNIEIDGTSTNAYLNKLIIKTKEIKNVFNKKNELIYDIQLKKSKMYIQLSNSIETIDLFKSEKSSKLTWENRQVLYIGTDKNNYACVYQNNDNSLKDSMEISTLENKLISKIELMITPQHFDMYEGVVAVSSDKRIVLYNYFGKILKEYNSDANITEIVLFNEGKSLLVKIANKIYIETI